MNYLPTKNINQNNEDTQWIVIAVLVGFGLTFCGTVFIFVIKCRRKRKFRKHTQQMDDDGLRKSISSKQSSADITMPKMSKMTKSLSIGMTNGCIVYYAQDGLSDSDAEDLYIAGEKNEEVSTPQTTAISPGTEVYDSESDQEGGTKTRKRM